MRLGLIGKKLGHSWSQRYFQQKFQQLGLEDYSYELFELADISELPRLLHDNPDLRGLNVTVPYKQSIIPYLDELTEEARAIGAVNTLERKGTKWIGHNTDVIGFGALLDEMAPKSKGPVLILGTGGAAQAVRYVLEQRSIPYQFVSRNAAQGLIYSDLTGQIVKEHPLIIQTTPVGMYPKVNEVLPFPFEALDKGHTVIDLIYNPEQTEFMKRAAERGAKVANGLTMLQAQAEASWKIWIAAL